jgi:hypothetical protein
VIRDQFDNQIPQGELVTVTTSAGTITSFDENGVLGGVQRPIGADGTIQFEIRSSDTPGTATITMASVNGSAYGEIQVVFAPRPDIQTASAPVPDAVIVGNEYRFKVPVDNGSDTGVYLTTATTFAFSDPDGTEFSATLQNNQFISGGVTADTLVFTLTAVPLAIEPARYQPTIQFAGTDEHGETYSETNLLPVQSLLVSSIRITSITNPPAINRGTTDVVQVTVQNPTPDPVEITQATLDFIEVTGPPKLYGEQVEANLPLTINAGQSGIVQIQVPVLPGSEIGVDEIVGLEIEFLEADRAELPA